MSKKFKIPEMLVGNPESDSDAFMETYNAATKHGKQHAKAEADLLVAWDLTNVLRGFLNETQIAECAAAVTVVEQIEKQISKAYDRVDKASIRHKNLFLAHFLGGASCAK